MGREPGDQIRPSRDEAGLRAGEELVGGEGDAVRAVRQARGHRGFSRDAELVQRDDAPGSVVVHPGDPRLPSESSDLARQRSLRIAADLVVGRVHGQEKRRPAGERAPVVLDRRPIRSPDFRQLRAGGFEDLRDLEAPADRDELAPGDQDAAAPSERREAEEDRRGVVVDGESVLGSEEIARRGPHVDLPMSALPGRRVVLESRVTGRNLRESFAGWIGERGTAEVRVEQDAGGVDSAHERRGEPAIERPPSAR
jgi:hypothetical protein